MSAVIRSWLIWTAGFLAFPFAGLAGTALAGRIDSPLAALTGGLITGAVIGAAQALCSSRRLDPRRWILASAVGMDKAVMKKLFVDAGLPVGPYLEARRRDWDRDAATIRRRVHEELGYPVFVKPANLGSSVGISKAKSEADLNTAMELALQFDRKTVIEAGVPNAREIECAVLGNDEPAASLPGEVIPSREFYDYEAKYLDNASKTVIPASLSESETAEVRRMAIEAFRAVDGSGMARVDFFLSRDTGKLFVNEVNTIPGFTTISMYPQMWEASGLPYPDLLDRLIQLAIERHSQKQQLRTSITDERR